jgi:hypothetical protein
MRARCVPGAWGGHRQKYDISTVQESPECADQRWRTCPGQIAPRSDARPSTGRVVCRVADEEAFCRISEAVLRAGCWPLRITGDLRPLTKACPVAIVYDLLAPDSEAALKFVFDWRCTHPSRPMLLYYTPSVDAAGIVGRVACLPGRHSPRPNANSR